MRKPATHEPQPHGRTRVAPASTTLLASIVSSSDDAIDSKTLDGIITSWNPAAERMYGYSADEVLGKNISMLSHPDRPEEMDEILQKIRNGERVEHYETVRVRKDGRRISISLSVSPILDDAGKVVGVSSIARDITERASTALLASLVHSSDDAIDSKTLDGIITSWNPAAEQMYGYSANEIIGKNISMLSHPDRPEEMDEILQRIRNGERVEHYETVRVRKDGRRISISLTVSPILDGAGKVVGVSSIARDVTERTGATKTLLASIVNSSDDAIDSKTLDGIITSWNRAAERMYGYYRRRDHRQEHLDAVPVRTGPEEMDEILEQIRNGERVEHYETVRRRKDGRSTISISLTVSPILDDDRQARRRLLHRARHHRAQARRRAAPRHLPVRPEPHRGEPRPAGHHQPGGQDHRRERGRRSR